jgi:hypothetical protein
MLESPGLLIRPWTTSVGPESPSRQRVAVQTKRRTILNAATGSAMGFACWRAETKLLWWLTRAVVEVYETEDASLLCTAHGRWGRPWRWEVRDADDHAVGSFRGGELKLPPDLVQLGKLRPLPGRGQAQYRGALVLDRFGQFLAWIEGVPIDRAVRRLLAPAGQELGTVAVTPEGVVLRFAVTLEGDPFARMVLLAAVVGLW